MGEGKLVIIVSGALKTDEETPPDFILKYHNYNKKKWYEKCSTITFYKSCSHYLDSQLGFKISVNELK